MTVKSPAVVKLFGEHAVVYGKTAIAAAVDFHATAFVTETNDNKLTITVTRPESTQYFSKRDLVVLNRFYKERRGIDSFLSFMAMTGNPEMKKYMLPFAVMAARLYAEENVNVLGRKVVIESNIPKQKGLASSAACSTAFTTALLRSSDQQLSTSV